MAREKDQTTPQSSHSSTSDAQEWRFIHIPAHSTAASLTPEGMEHKTRSRASSVVQSDGNVSDSSQYIRARAPIKEAVDSAFSKEAEVGGIAPEVITQLTSQITANVIRHLQSGSLGGALTSPTQETTASALTDPISPRKSVDDTNNSSATPRSPSMAYVHISHPMSQDSVQPSSPAKKTPEISKGDESSGEDIRRPKPVQRVSTDGDLSSLEKAWGKLYDKQHQPTPRLGQLLRGIATYLVERYEPQNSLVIPPEKLIRYYHETHVENDIYPWQLIFDHRTSSISRMYRDLEVEHHLVQEPDKLGDRPELPGLTPNGFEMWVRLLLRAQPDVEYQRLAKTVRQLPIENADLRSERFPKELPERLFYRDIDESAIRKIQDAMAQHCRVNIARKVSSSEATIGHPQVSPRATLFETTSMPAMRNGDGQSKNVAPGADHATPLNSDRHESQQETGPPLERKRKPYVGDTSGGKVYDRLGVPSSVDTRVPPPEPKLTRSHSTTGTVRPSAIRTSDIPVSLHQTPSSAHADGFDLRRQRSNTGYGHDLPERGGRRSPSPPADLDGNDLRRHRSSVAPGYEAPSRSGRHRSPSLNHQSSYGHSGDQDPAHGSSTASTGGQLSEEARRIRDWERNRERLAGDRFDAARMAAYDPQQRDSERGGEFRQRLASVSGYDVNNRPYLNHDDHHTRQGQRYPTTTRDGHPVVYTSNAQYPPSSYRDTR